MRELKDFTGRDLTLGVSTDKFPYTFPIHLVDAEARELKDAEVRELKDVE